MNKKQKLQPQKICSEILTLTYGSLIQELIQQYDNCSQVNEQLEKMGINIGGRLIDEYLARSDQKPCLSFQQVAESVATNAFEMFLGIRAQVQNFQQKDSITSFSLIFSDNPLNDFVQLPDEYKDLHYSNLICGVIKGALAQIQIQSECKFVKDQLKGDQTSEIVIHMQKEIK